VIVADVSLGGMSGLDLARRLRGDTRTRGAGIIVLTGHAFGRIKDKAEAAGCDRSLLKPCLPDVLALEIRDVLLQREGARWTVESARLSRMAQPEDVRSATARSSSPVVIRFSPSVWRWNGVASSVGIACGTNERGCAKAAVAIIESSSEMCNGHTHSATRTALSHDTPRPAPIDREPIAHRAYKLFCARSCRDGHDVDDWLCAEREWRTSDSVNQTALEAPRVALTDVEMEPSSGTQRQERLHQSHPTQPELWEETNRVSPYEQAFNRIRAEFT
jgi:CheY-like chemotaxis protein